MARVPVVESPCPIADRPLPRGASDHCGVCDRAVHNLDRMNDVERREFMASCSGKVCVAYTVRIPQGGLRKRALAAAALAAAALASLPVAAQEPSGIEGQSGMPDPNGLPRCDDYEIWVGGISKADQAEWTDDNKDAPPELPTVVDDGK